VSSRARRSARSRSRFSRARSSPGAPRPPRPPLSTWRCLTRRRSSDPTEGERRRRGEGEREGERGRRREGERGRRREGEREFERSRRFRLTRLAEAEEEEAERSLRCFARPFFAGRSSDSDSDSFLAFLRFSFFSFFSGFFRSRFFFLSSEASLSPPSSSENARIFDFPMCSLPRLGRALPRGPETQRANTLRFFLR